MLVRRKPARSGIRAQEGPIRSIAHLQHVRGFVCAAHTRGECQGPVQAHHVRTAATAGIGVKPGDDRAVPLCAHHHRLVHDLGQETFEIQNGVDLARIAENLARSSAHIQRLRREGGGA